MKKQLLFAALAIATLFSACNKEEELSQNNGSTPVNFVIGGVGARTTTNDTFVASFEADDKVGIFSTGLKDTQITNGQYKVTNSNNIYSLEPVNSGDFYFDNDADATFYAYYPYATDAASSAVTLTVKDDQNVSDDADNFNCNDLLVATQTVAAGAATADGVTLNFDHVMSFVELTFGDNLSTIGVSEVAMTIASPTITYNFTSTEATKYAVSGNETSIKMYNKDTNKFWAIVPPQTIESGKTLFTITAANGSTYTYTVAADATEIFASNAIRKIKLDVASTEEPETATVFKIASISINGWGTIPTKEEEVKEVEEVKLNVTATLSTPTSTTSGRSDFSTADTWLNHSLGSALYDNTTEQAMSITKGTNGSWYNNTLYYWFGADNKVFPGKKYTINFDVKAVKSSQESTATSAKIDIIVLNKEKGTVNGDSNKDIIYVLDSDDSATTGVTRKSNTLTLDASDYTTYTISFDPGKVLASAVTTATTFYTIETEGNVVIAFAPQMADVTYYIKNIKIEQQ